MIKKIAAGSGLAIVVVLLLGWQLLGWFSSEPEAVNIDSALEAAASTTSTTAAESASSTSELPLQASIEDLSGTWLLESSDATFVGYRIFEVLSGADFEAVGRTKLVTGTMVGEGLTINEVTVIADLTGLTSDSRLRDGQLKRQALETSQFPEAVFELTSPLTIESIPVDRQSVAFAASGDLTLHGVTRSVTIPIQASTLDGKIVIVGALKVALEDFEIDKPSAPAVASVSDEATMELSLVFSRS